MRLEGQDFFGLSPYHPSQDPLNPGTVGSYADTSAEEDFAQTFAFVVYAYNGRWANSLLPQLLRKEFHEPSWSRQDFMRNLLHRW